MSAKRRIGRLSTCGAVALAEDLDESAPVAEIGINAVVVGRSTTTSVTVAEAGASMTEVATEEAATIAVTTMGGAPATDPRPDAVVTAVDIIGGLIAVVVTLVVTTLAGMANDEVTEVVGATVTTGRGAVEVAVARSSLSTISAHVPDKGLKSSSASP